MDITFAKENDSYVARVEVNRDFNVHLEFDVKSTVVIRQNTAGNNYAYLASFSAILDVDTDFDGIVWPKNIEIVASSNPTTAIITES